ncbi:MAG TPA: hypothetical protein VGI81_05150 [Tepidisphaeraceae bacterium]|jgi:hypothetical protein
MVTIDGAVIEELGVTFAIVVVQQHVLNSPEDARPAFRRYFPGMPIVLAAQDAFGTFEYQGRRDLVEFLASISPDRIPWKQYTFS